MLASYRKSSCHQTAERWGWLSDEQRVCKFCSLRYPEEVEATFLCPLLRSISTTDFAGSQSIAVMSIVVYPKGEKPSF